MGAVDMRGFWDRRAREDAFHFVDSREPYRAADAERFWARGQEDLDTLLSSLGVEIEPGDHVVDLGCGVGRLTRVLAARAARVTAIDVSPAMLAQARALHGELENVAWVEGDGASLTGVADDSVDAVVSHVVLQHIPDAAVQLGYVAEAGRVLRPGGWAALTISTDPAIHRPRGGWRERLRGPRGRTRPEWLGTALRVEDVEAAARHGGGVVERVAGAGTQFTLVRLAKP